MRIYLRNNLKVSNYSCRNSARASARCSSRCSLARRFAGLAQLSECGAGGGEPNHPQHLMQEDGAEFAPLVAA